MLREIEFIGNESERIVLGGKVEHGVVILTGTHEGLEQLAEWVAAEANHEPNRRREKRLDSAFLHLSEMLEHVAVSKEAFRARAESPARGAQSDSNRHIRGTWRIEDSDLWDRDALDLLGPAYVEFLPDGTGSFRFIAVEGWMDCRPAFIDGQPGVEFSWEGADEGDPVSGRGRAAELDDDRLQLHIYFHMGDESGFQARRVESTSHLLRSERHI